MKERMSGSDYATDEGTLLAVLTLMTLMTLMAVDVSCSLKFWLKTSLRT
jgi:hypothetical protein